MRTLKFDRPSVVLDITGATRAELEVLTYCNLPQDNTWSESWEAFFDRGLWHVLKVREERAGPSAELDALLPSLFEKVIPRLLRPLESEGRKIRPSLIHRDLWCGNANMDMNTWEPIVYDPASFWAHNECTSCPIPGMYTEFDR